MANSNTAGQFYVSLEKTFAKAWQQTTTAPKSLMLTIDAAQIRIRCTSPTLLERIRRPLAHLQTPGRDFTPDIAIDLIDAAAAELAMPDLPWQPQQTSVEQDTHEYRADPYLFTRHGDCVLTARNEIEQRTIGIVRDPANWPLAHYKQAIFITLYQHLRWRDLYLIHASAVGRRDKAVLIAGSSGAGKTTTMLTCVRAGFNFLGDDTTLVRPGAAGPAQIISLLGTLNVTKQTLDWFPELKPHLSQETNRFGKWLVMVDEVYPGVIARQADVVAMLAPEVTGEPQTTLEPASKAGLLSDMLFYSLDLHDAAAARHHLDFLAGLLESVPSYRLRLGQDRERLPALLDELLR